MAENEKTSEAIGKDGAFVAKLSDAQLVTFAIRYPKRLRSIAASAWTQMPDKAPQPPRKKILGLF